MTESRLKNIVLCSDGTGQSGRKSQGTNVWKIRMAVNRHDHDYGAEPSRPQQIVFYDAGVGTSALSVKKLLGSAFGYGLADNMRELYTSLARSYKKGDKIYIFGFSRGAFTARSLAGMISELGVIHGDCDDKDLGDLVKAGYKAYRSSPRGHPIEKFHKACEKCGVEIDKTAKVHFVGVWDTVAAYGMPIAELRDAMYWVIKKIWRPHEDQLTDKMEHAFHALAIDEDRHSFTPTMYDVNNNGQGKKTTNVDVDQVWFAGAHSNVGGGYPRQGLSDEALEWMMTRAEQHGLRFTNGARAEVRRERDANSTIYDQRSGPGVIWRYRPRDVAGLCRDAGCTPQIHVSAMGRINLRTAGYAPITLPNHFEVVGHKHDASQLARLEQLEGHPSDEARGVERFGNVASKSESVRGAQEDQAKKLIGRRRWLYRLFLAYLGVVGFLAVWFYNDAGAAKWYADNSLLTRLGGAIGDGAGFTGAVGTVWGWITSGVLALVPTQFLDDFVAETFSKRPSFIVGLVLVGLVLLWRHMAIVGQMKHLGLETWREAFRTAEKAE